MGEGLPSHHVVVAITHHGRDFHDGPVDRLGGDDGLDQPRTLLHGSGCAIVQVYRGHCLGGPHQHLFEQIDLPHLRPEDVDDHVARVDQDPIAAILALPLYSPVYCSLPVSLAVT